MSNTLPTVLFLTKNPILPSYRAVGRCAHGYIFIYTIQDSEVVETKQLPNPLTTVEWFNLVKLHEDAFEGQGLCQYGHGYE